MFDRKLSVQSDQIVSDYKSEKEQLLKTISEQSKRLKELEAENEDLQRSKALNSFNKKERNFNHKRLKTQPNILFDGDESTDFLANNIDPFGVNEEFDAEEAQDTFIAFDDEEIDLMENQSDSQSETDDRLENIRYNFSDPAQCGAQDLLINDQKSNDVTNNGNEYILPSTKDPSLDSNGETTSNACSCLFSFFQKLKKKNSSFSQPLLDDKL